ncbi:MAG: hypothetical protein GVY23_09760 [Spirochaetes bacterium]|nr:hypothetical protein [Spirochaetota bacterium]
MRNHIPAAILAFAIAFMTVATPDAVSQDDTTDQLEREQPAWAFAEHSFTDEDLRVEISQFLQNGYVPVGMESEPDGTLRVLYALNTWFEFSNWAIQEFTNLGNLNAEMTAVLQEGWLPMAMSATDDGLQVLFIETDIQLDAWQIATGPLSVDSALATLESWRNDGYTPWALTLTPDDEVWYLFLQTDAVPNRAALFNGFENSQAAITQGINSDIEEAWYPWGLMRGDRTTFVQYLR